MARKPGLAARPQPMMTKAPTPAAVEPPAQPAPPPPPVMVLTAEDLDKIAERLRPLLAPPSAPDLPAPITLGDGEAELPAVDPLAVEARVGLSVLYRMTQRDIDQIIARRVKLSARGNAPLVGALYGGIVVATSGPLIASICVFLDGEDSLWVQHRPRGAQHGHWRAA